MYIDEDGDAEANYTVVALKYDDLATDDQPARSLHPVGHFTSHGNKLPVGTKGYIQQLKLPKLVCLSEFTCAS